MKKTLLSLIILSVILLGACSSARPATQPPAGTPAVAYGTAGRAYLKSLTDLGARLPGSDAEARAAKFISDAFNGMGYSVESQPFSGMDQQGSSVTSANVIAVKTGKSDREIIVGAHYDSAGSGSGADDNASGVAVMLEAAELLKNESTPYTIRFIAFGADEAGSLGAYAYINQMSQSEFDNTVAMVNLDSVVAGDTAYVFSEEGQPAALRDWLLEWAFGNGLDLQTVRSVDFSKKNGIDPADYAAFQQVGIPFISLEAADWSLGSQDGSIQVDPKYGEQGVIRHTRYDTTEYLDSNFPGRVDQHLDLFVRLLHNLLMQYEAPVQ